MWRRALSIKVRIETSYDDDEIQTHVFNEDPVDKFDEFTTAVPFRNKIYTRPSDRLSVV